MRRALVSVILGLFALTAFGQMAPDIAKGTSAEDVIRTYGWPKGKSVTGGRESWLYDRFQVLFQNGKVVSVTYIASTAPEALALTPPRNVSVTDPGTVQPRPTVPSQPSPAVRRPPARRERKSPDSDYMVKREPEARVATEWWTGLSTLQVVAIISLSGILLGLVVLAINRREAARKLSDELLERQRNGKVRKPKTWKEEVAEKLDQANGSKKQATTVTVGGGTVDGAGGTPAVPAARPVIDELTIDLLRTLEWKRFELLTVLYFNATGVRAEATCIGADGGVDAHLYRNGETTPFSYVQCKAWGARPVDVKPVRELFGVMAANDIREGVFMATGDFSLEARAFVAGRSLVLVSGSEVVTRFNGLPTAVRQTILAEVTDGDYTTPTCPRCDIKLLLRDNAKDQSSFWGCSNYPRCHYTMKARADVMDG